MSAYDVSNYFGLLIMCGATRLDFVHRMSSGEVRKLTPGTGASTCFTTPIGRIVDYTRVLCVDDALLLLTGGGNADALARWLRKYVFFNDDVQIADETAAAAFSMHALDAAPEPLRALGVLGHVAIDTDRWVRLRVGAADFALRIGATILPDLAPAAEFDALRIALGQPFFPNELNGDVIPLEAGVWDAVSFSKGCYIGQEIIARMESRNQIAKKLVRLERISGALNAGDALLVNGVPAGTLTSVSGDHALGYLRSTFVEAGRVIATTAGEVRVVAGDGR
jgi:tRNA-modifying protein YgfZ